MQCGEQPQPDSNAASDGLIIEALASAINKPLAVGGHEANLQSNIHSGGTQSFAMCFGLRA